MNLEKINKVHFIGIGGIGMSALAQLYLNLGKIVSGSDLGKSPVTEVLSEKGAHICMGHNKDHISEKTDLIIYSDAVPKDNPERLQANEYGIPQKSYFEALGEFANKYKLIAVSGAHGKTTTTAMVIDIFEEIGLDPMAIVGSLRAKTKTNFRAGKGEYFIVEADEYMRHFLQFKPYILLINNIDNDHLDYYKDLSDIQSAFNELAKKVPQNGFVICDKDDEKVKPALLDVSAKIVDYKDFFDKDITLKVFGEHNRKNAAGALAVSSAVKIHTEIAKKILANFSGTWRRLEYKGETKAGAIIYDDYAHHPAEIKATLSGAREKFRDKEICIVFQPHLYSRTKLLLNDFAEELSKADYVILAPIYAAREKKDETISSEILAEKIKEKNKNVLSFKNLEEMTEYLRKSAVKDDVIITMGAGDIYKVGEMLL